MPWEKSFDEDEVVGKAMKVFWKKGFESASMADLITGTGITRGSLYNAFGGKKELFVKTLLKYDKDNRRALLAELEAMDDPLRAIAALFDALVAETISDAEKKGCFLVNTASELTTHDEEVNSIVRNGLREIQAFFRRSIEVAQARKQIADTVDPEVTAKGLMAMVVGIRVLGRGMFDASSLETIATQAQRLLR
ncbi:MAG: TetR/AcrR family transcriptional repressor of nem operon [Bradyrhizobium sp.]|jgi:TetR/AcrR family transcriptional repressor of nem operon